MENKIQISLILGLMGACASPFGYGQDSQSDQASYSEPDYDEFARRPPSSPYDTAEPTDTLAFRNEIEEGPLADGGSLRVRVNIDPSDDLQFRSSIEENLAIRNVATVYDPEWNRVVPELTVAGTCPGESQIQVLRGDVFVDRTVLQIRALKSIEAISGDFLNQVACDAGQCEFSLFARPEPLERGETLQQAERVVDCNADVRSSLKLERLDADWSYRFSDPGADLVSVTVELAGQVVKLDLPLLRGAVLPAESDADPELQSPSDLSAE